MKEFFVGNLVPNEVVTTQFLVLSKEVRQKKTGEPYLTLHLADKTGEIEARMWDNVAEVMETFDRDDFVKVKGLVQVYQNRSQITVHKLRRLEDHEVQHADFFPCSERDAEEMFRDLLGIIAGVRNADLRNLLDAIFADPEIAARYKHAPAAKNIHHACRGGLLEHVLSLCGLSRLISTHYKNIDLDLLITGALLHDIGKIEELSYARSIAYSADGQLLGHIVIGLRIVGDKLSHMPNFPHTLRTLLEHMIISHHGELAFGSPKVPIFYEALLLHHLDNLDSKMDAMRGALKRDPLAEGDFTGWVSSLERVLLKKDRYLATTNNADAAQPVKPERDAGPEQTDEAEPVARAESVAPATVIPNHPSSQETPPHRPTFFGEKLQAVLDSRK